MKKKEDKISKTLQILELDIKEIKENPDNTRKHNYRNIETIKDSLLKFGQYQPIIINKKNIVIAGNGRLQAIKELGWNKVQVLRINKDNLSEKAIGIIDNRSAELATWNIELLLEEMNLINSSNKFKIEALGFEQLEMDDMLKSLGDNIITKELDIEELEKIEDKEPVLKEILAVQVILKTELEQESLYKELLSRGLECQILRL